MTAQEIFDRIKTGHRNPTQRPDNQSVDRSLRDLVKIANMTGDCIINVGEGYYRVNIDDIVDMKEFHEYMAKDRSRIREIELKQKAMYNAVNRKKRERFENWSREHNQL